MGSMWRFLAILVCGVLLAPSGGLAGGLAQGRGAVPVMRLQGGRGEAGDKVKGPVPKRKGLPWQHRIRDIFGIKKPVNGMPYGSRRANMTEASFRVPKGPKQRAMPKTPKRFRFNTIFKNMTHYCQSREDPGEMEEQVATHVPKVEVVEEGFKVTCGELDHGKGLHYVEYLWLMTEDGSKMLGHEVRGPKDDSSATFPKRLVCDLIEGDTVHNIVPYIGCSQHGPWKGDVFKIPAKMVDEAKKEKAEMGKRREERLGKRKEWIEAHPRPSKKGKGGDKMKTD